MAWYYSFPPNGADPRDYFSRSKSPVGTVLLLLNTTILTFFAISSLQRGMIWGMIWHKNVKIVVLSSKSTVPAGDLDLEK